MPLQVKPYRFSVVFYDAAWQQIYQWSDELNGDMDPPSPPVGTTFELAAGQDHFLGTVQDVRHFVTTDANYMTYAVAVVCRDSHAV